jgi:hypothetical protein
LDPAQLHAQCWLVLELEYVIEEKVFYGRSDYG